MPLRPSRKAQERAQRLRKTVLYVAYERVGMRRGIRACTFLVWWGIGSDEAGHALSAEEYATWAKKSRATAFRELGDFREAFPGHDTPERIWAEVRRQVRVREDRSAVAAEAMGAVLPAEMA